MNHCWMSPIIRSANAVEKMHVFWAWSSLRMSACTVPRTVRTVRSSELRVLRRGRGCARARSRKTSTCWSKAVFMNIASRMGAGPLIVMETDVFGSHRSKPA